jgi:hypothetical protein
MNGEPDSEQPQQDAGGTQRERDSLNRCHGSSHARSPRWPVIRRVLSRDPHPRRRARMSRISANRSLKAASISSSGQVV